MNFYQEFSYFSKVFLSISYRDAVSLDKTRNQKGSCDN